MVAAFVLGTLAGEAHGMAVRVRWMPSGEGVSGYKVYARTLPDEWGVATDVGGLAVGEDGAIQAVLADLAPDRSWGFAVSAYGADGSESALSNEIQIGPDGGPPACGDDCAPRSGCPMVTNRFALRRSRLGWRLVVRGAFPAATAEPGALAVAVTGDGTPLLAENVPESDVKRRRKAVFRYRRPRGRRASGDTGIRRLVLRSYVDVTNVMLTATWPAGDGTETPTAVAWSLQVADGCLRTDDLTCRSPGPASVVCD